MLKSIKISLKDTFIYGLGNVAVKLVGFLLIPLFTKKEYFSLDDFGIYGLLEISGVILAATMASALPQSFARWFWDKDHKANQKGIFFMSYTTQLIVSILFCLALIPLAGRASVLLFSRPDLSRVISLVIISSAIQSVGNIVNTLMRLQSKSLLYSLTNLLKLSFVLGLTLYFIIVRKMGLEGIYLAQVIGNSLIVLALIGYTIRNSTIFFDKTIFKSMNTYGFPLLLANVSTALLTVIDRFSLDFVSLTALKSVGLYTLAFKITSTLKMVIVDSIRLAMGPMMFKKMDSPDYKRFYSKVLLYSSYIMMFAIVGVSMFSFELIKVMAGTKEYWGAVVIIPFLALSVFFVNLKDVTIYGLHFAKKTNIIGIIVILSTVLGLGLNILLIPKWDITGSAVATLVSQFVYFLACYYYSQKFFYIPYEMRKIVIIFFVGAALSISSLFFNGMELLPRLILKSAGLISFPFILYLFNFYEPVEIQSIKGFLAKWAQFRNLKSNLNSLREITDTD
jgi:O-antigen/teichoic acid export membrane protein